MAKLSLSDLHAIREREEKNLKKRDIHGRTVHVVVAMGTSGIDAGAKLTLNTILAERTGQSIDTIARDTDRDNYMNPIQAKQYGIIDFGINNGESFCKGEEKREFGIQ